MPTEPRRPLTPAWTAVARPLSTSSSPRTSAPETRKPFRSTSPIERAARDAIELATRCVGSAGLVRPLPFAQLVCDLHMLLGDPGADAALARSGEIGLRMGTTLHSVTMSDSLRSVV